MPPTLLSCGSNAASQLSINHPDDVYVLTPTVFHPSIEPLPLSSKILQVVSASSHSLLLLSIPEDDPRVRSRNLLLGAGTNTFGQLGPRCALWDDVKPQQSWKHLDFLGSSDVEGIWEPVKVASTWTTSFVVYQNIPDANQRDGSSSELSDRSEVRQIVLACGSNDFGELGTSSPIRVANTPAPIPISQASQKPTVVSLGLKSGETVEIIKGGQRHVVAVIKGKEGQRIMGWGASRKGELSANSLSKDGPSSSMVVSSKAKGKGKANTYPASSPPIRVDLPIPVGDCVVDIALGASHSLALLSSGIVFGWGSDVKGQLRGVYEMTNVRGIAATWGGSYFLQANTIYSQGSNTHSQLLQGPEPSAVRGKVVLPEGWQVEKIVAGSEHLLVTARKSGDVELFAGGWNEHGNLAMGDQRDRDLLEMIGRGEPKVRNIWGGCASTWVWVE